MHCSHSAPHWDNLEEHYVFMHKEQIMLLQAIASLISIKESDKKEQKIKLHERTQEECLFYYILQKAKLGIEKKPAIWRWKHRCVWYSLCLNCMQELPSKGRVRSPQDYHNVSWHYWTTLILGRYSFRDRIWIREKIYHSESAKSFQNKEKALLTSSILMAYP